MSTSSLTATSIANAFDINFIYARQLFQSVGEDSTLEDVQKLINAKPKPFVKWVGGKRQLLKQFRELGLYPPEAFNPITNTYHEPFVGGGAVFFDLLPKNAKLSDLNNELVITYNVIKNNVEELINKSGQFNAPFGRYNNPVICDEHNLRRVSNALQDVIITHQDYKKVLETAQNGDFVYFDPPYYPINTTSSFTSYTVEGFLEKEQTELRNTFVKLHEKGCFVMLSNSDTPFINELYSGINGVTINKITAGRAINSKGTGRGKITEVLVTNY